MKKTTTFLMFLSLMVIFLTQSCKEKIIVEPKDRTVSDDTAYFHVPKDTVAIYLTSLKRNDGHGNYSYHLAMFDGNGDYGIDTLTTVYRFDTLTLKVKSGNIQWIKVINSGIKKITEIKPLEDPTIIFQNGTYEHPHGVWNLNLEGINIPPGDTLKEKYIIKYIPKDTKDTVIIDPYLRIPD